MKMRPALLIALLPSIAAAEGIALTGKLGSLGFGGELTTPVSDTINLRVGLNAYNWNFTRTVSSVEYDARLSLQTASFIGDLYPIQDSIFRVSLGLFYNNNHLDLTAKPTGSAYNLNGRSYPSALAGTVTGNITFNKLAPYLGVGWGNAFAKESGWSFSLDVGAFYQGNAKLKLESAACSANATCAADLAAEQASAKSDLCQYRWWPAISAGATYRF